MKLLLKYTGTNSCSGYPLIPLRPILLKSPSPYIPPLQSLHGHPHSIQVIILWSLWLETAEINLIDHFFHCMSVVRYESHVSLLSLGEMTRSPQNEKKM